MAKHEGYYTCDLCDKRFESGQSVGNDVGIVVPGDGRAYGDVCNPCARAVMRMVDEAFPKNKHMGK